MSDKKSKKAKKRAQAEAKAMAAMREKLAERGRERAAEEHRTTPGADPFPPGNQVATKSGVRSPRIFLRLARELVDDLLARRPDLRGYPDAVEAWAQAEAQVALHRRWLALHGSFDTNSQPRDSALRWLNIFEKRAEAARAVLGLDPISEAKLAKERASASLLATDLRGLAEQGAMVLEQRDDEPRDRVGEILAEVIAEAPRHESTERARARRHEAKSTLT